VSPDGTQIAYFSIGEQQEDLFIGTPDGPMRRVTDDSARDRSPFFTPDGRSLVFYSNRDGTWAPWMIGTDGGGLRKIAKPQSESVYVLISPTGDSIVFASGSAQQLYRAPVTSGVSSPTQLTGNEVDGKYFGATDWSPDGLRLTGPLASKSNLPSGVGVYDIAASKTMALTNDQTFAVRWLADGRRVAYFTDNGARLIVLDTVTRTRTSVDVRLPGPSLGDMFALSPDNRTIYYGTSRAEADIWIVERK
jgi:TolB protein